MLSAALIVQGFEALPPVASRVSGLACDMKFAETKFRN
jgi:hypothetical protein